MVVVTEKDRVKVKYKIKISKNIKIKKLQIQIRCGEKVEFSQVKFSRKYVNCIETQ